MRQAAINSLTLRRVEQTGFNKGTVKSIISILSCDLTDQQDLDVEKTGG
jgi:hypothetical protein